MNFTSMDYFVAVAEERSFTHAARRLSVTQQTLSANIANTEHELGVRLINRKVPLTLTYAGQKFLAYARTFQAQERAMKQEFLDISNDESGLLGVGVAATRGHMIMPQAIASFREHHPGINVLLWEAENEALIQLLREGRVDMIVASVPPDAPGLVVHEVYREKIVLLLSEELARKTYPDDWEGRLERVRHSYDLSPLADIPYMLLGQKDEPGLLAREILERSKVRPHVSVHSQNSETLAALALRSQGACFVPLSMVVSTFGDWHEHGLLVVDLGPDAYIDISCAWRDTMHVWSVIKAFYEVVLALNGGHYQKDVRLEDGELEEGGRR